MRFGREQAHGMAERRCKLGNAVPAAALAVVVGLAIPVPLSEIAKADTDRDWWAPIGHVSGAYEHSAVRNWEANPPRGYPTLSRANIAPMKAAIKRYAAIVAGGGWKPVPEVELSRGQSSQAVPYLRRRLELVGDLSAAPYYTYDYDSYVEAAVQRFQVRHGLSPTGNLDKSTIAALNVTAKVRLRQLRTNLSRLRRAARSAAKRYVMVNIPAAQIEAVEDDRVVSRHSAVVGKLDRRTPVLRSRIHEINFNPFWRIPQSIVRKDLVPKARQYARLGKDVLGTYRIDAFAKGGRKLDPSEIDWSSRAVYGYRYRQRPWKDNSMGFVKINFPNGHAVYMHDTPSKSLFRRNFRAHSSGCVRVRNVEQLVTWLLAGNSGWDAARVAHMKYAGERRDVRLKRRVPVYFAYITAWATKDGTVRFRRDLYRRDGVGVTASAY